MPVPKMFALLPEAKQQLLSFAAANLDKISIEKVQTYWNGTLIPSLCKEYTAGIDKAGGKEDCLSLQEFLEFELGLSMDGILVEG